MGPLSKVAIGFFFAGAVAIAGGCNLISGLSDLSIAATTTLGTSSSTGGGGTGGSGGETGGTTGSGGTTSTDSGACSDMAKNGDETDTDCGGPTCSKRCAAHQTCKVSSDCETEICEGKCETATQIAVGNAFACAVYCWGANGRGQLGTGARDASSKPVKVSLANVVQVTAGGTPQTPNDGHACARTGDGAVHCWGANEHGQLGTGDTKDFSLPATIPGLESAKHVAAGGAFGCAIQSNDTVACWGSNEFGELADGGGPDSPDPVAAIDLGKVTGLGLGNRHGCAALAGGVVWCWGNNSRKELASEAISSAAKAGLVAGVASPKLVRAGSDFSCALEEAGLRCWGDNSDSQLTDAVAGDLTATPTTVALADVSAVALGSDGDAAASNDPAGGHACALLPMGEVACWGNNRSGQLGRGTKSEKEAVPAKVAGLTGVLEIAVGAEISCARLTSGAVRCWGRNDVGQLGAGMTGDAQSSPLPVAWP
jgi:alpha-tubulin suppressor-like RCC1 family protein